MEVLKAHRRLRLPISGILFAILMMAGPAGVAGQDQDEYAVKAAFIFNFTKFIEWPQNSNSSNFGICILGDDPFDAAIDQLTRGKSVYGHLIQVRRIKESADAKFCQIAFVNSAERGKAAKLVEAVRGMPVLTVGETEDFLRMGGLVALSMEDSHVNIVINASSTQNANLKVSAKLLTLARLYKSN